MDESNGSQGILDETGALETVGEKLSRRGKERGAEESKQGQRPGLSLCAPLFLSLRTSASVFLSSDA